jgi:hypothetical protein
VTNRIPWPRDAQIARDESAEHANAIIAELEALIDGKTSVSDYEQGVAIGRALNHAHKICRLLEREGAQTIPTAR